MPSLLSDNPESGHITEVINKAEYTDVLQHEENVCRLKEIVDKVVELHAMGELVDNTEMNENVVEVPPKTEEKIKEQNLEETNSMEKNDKDPAPEQDTEKLVATTEM